MAFEPIATERLLLRGPTLDDLDPLTARRSDPDVARYQSWTAPYPRERARELLADVSTMAGPELDRWWLATVCERGSGDVLGDVAVQLSEHGNVAEIGYTFAADHWGKGFATEAVEAICGHLFLAAGVGRVWATLAPENLASARVLEHTGFLFEGRGRLSHWPDPDADPAEGPGDDLRYAMTRADWQAWRERPTGQPNRVRLVEITSANQRAVAELVTHKSQERFVAPVSRSYGDALFPHVENGVAVEPMMRAIEADGVLAGFMLVALRTPRYGEPYLWRLLIDRSHQRRGIGSLALDQLEDRLRRDGHRAIFVSWGPGSDSPAPFYLDRGFEPTGRGSMGETNARKQL
ncbi:MAG: GNAT family N-acetyltransferase [Acidimicrobiales bacterium]